MRNINVINHKINLGKGAAIRSGLKKAKGDIILIQDADLEYNPKDYRLVLTPFIKNNADVVYGSRTLGIKKYKNGRFFIGKALVTQTIHQN